ncbi:MAG: chorismate mutase [Candidatus Brocadiae bacterium]|nr:chorismate mutase [Candidatus Brocadiia bacterium]
MLRGVRGAVGIEENTREAILAATRDLLARLAEANALRPDAMSMILFTATTDLTAAFPATAARELGWTRVPLMCSPELDVTGAPPRIVRVMILAETPLDPAQIRHLYLGRAAVLRPDLAPDAGR